MKCLSLIVILLVSAQFASAERVSVGDTKVTFEPPPGFTPLSKEIIDLKWPSNRAPKYAVGNETAATTVAYDLKPHKIPQAKLPEAHQAFTSMFERMIPGIEWKKNEIVEHSGQKWIVMEMTSRAVDTDIYNILFATGYGDEMLIFNFNSTKKEFPKYEADLRASLASIKLP